MHDLVRDLGLPVSGFAMLAAAGVLWLFCPSQRPARTWRSTWIDLREAFRQEAVRRQVAFFALCVIAGGSVFLLPVLPGLFTWRSIDGARILGGTLIEAAADPVAAIASCSVLITIGSVMLMPLCDERWVGPRSATPPWPPSGRVFSHHRWKWLSRILACLGVSTVFGCLLFHSITTGAITGLFVYLFYLGWSTRRWLEIDDVGVNWGGYRFRWEEVVSWKVAYTPYTGSGDDGGDEEYRLFVTLASGLTLDREDIHPHQLENLFYANVLDKLQEAEPLSWPPKLIENDDRFATG